MYLIWSYEHEAWWAPNRFGYTRELERAGRYDGAHAAAIVAGANLVTINEQIVNEAHAKVFSPARWDQINAKTRSR